MPRRLRAYIPEIPVHVVHRGNNREPVFFAEEDYLFYLECLQTGLRRYRAALHAWCLMTNHVHLLITPEREDSIPRILQHIGRMYVRHINKTYRRSGTLWEGRHKSSVVDANSYLLKCYRYIELNPVAANMVLHPGDYRWSSYACNGQGVHQPMVTPHAVYAALGTHPEQRCFAYRELLRYALDREEVHEIRKALECNYPLGSERFRDAVEAKLQRRVGYKDIGRPVERNAAQK